MALAWTPSMDAVLLTIVAENPDATWTEVAALVSQELEIHLTQDQVRNRHGRANTLSKVVTDEESATALRRSLIETRNELEQMKLSRQDLQDAVFRAVEQGIAGLRIDPVTYVKTARANPQPVDVMLHGTDWQVGKYIKGAYDSDVARARVADHLQSTFDLSSRLKLDVEMAHWLLTGDLVEGETIFPSQQHRIDASLFRQVFAVSEMIVNGARKLLAEYPLVYIEGIGGNHGENLKNSHPETNFDCMAMEIARRILVNETRLTFPEPITPDEHHWAMWHKVRNETVFGVHGHQVRSQPNTKASRDRYLGWYANFGPFDIAISGHYHQSLLQDLGPFVHQAGGSPENNNTYAAEYLQTGAQRGSQWTTFIDDAGVVSNHLIRLS